MLKLTVCREAKVCTPPARFKVNDIVYFMSADDLSLHKAKILGLSVCTPSYEAWDFTMHRLVTVHQDSLFYSDKECVREVGPYIEALAEDRIKAFRYAMYISKKTICARIKELRRKIKKIRELRRKYA